MKKGRPRYPLIMALAGPLIMLACGSLTSPAGGLSIIASASPSSTGSVTFQVGVENVGSKTETLDFRNSQFCDIEVRNMSGTLVWRFSDGATFLDVLWGLELEPGESYTQELVWDSPGTGQRLLPTVYTAKILITSSPRKDFLSSVIRVSL
jgi:hypothetical protein